VIEYQLIITDNILKNRFSAGIESGKEREFSSIADSKLLVTGSVISSDASAQVTPTGKTAAERGEVAAAAPPAGTCLFF